MHIRTALALIVALYTGPGLAAVEEVKQLPLKPGVWEQIVLDGPRIVYGPSQVQNCGERMWFFLPSLFPAEKFGHTVPMEIIDADSVSHLRNGSFRVTGGARTTRAGDLTYTHLLTLEGDTRYNEILTVTKFAATHPVAKSYTGSGHWVAPCPVQAK